MGISVGIIHQLSFLGHKSIIYMIINGSNQLRDNITVQLEFDQL